MFDTSDEEQSCFKFYGWMKPRELGSAVKQYFEHTNNRVMAEPSSHRETAKIVEKSTRGYLEKAAISTRERFAMPLETDKENRVRKDSASSVNVVKRMKARYEEISSSRKNVMAIGTENTRPTGAIKKRVDFADDKNVATKKRVEFAEDKNGATRKRVEFTEDKNGATKKRVDFGDDKNAAIKKRLKTNTHDSDAFAKSRFKVYTDEQLPNCEASVTKKVDGKIEEKFANAQHVVQNRRLQKLQVLESRDTVNERFTPIDTLGVPLIPKKVKVQHRKSLMTESEKPSNFTGSISQDPAFQLPYQDNFVELELQKEKSRSVTSRGFRKKNITVEQRKIILKFLTRLNVHAFYPSFFLHQTVRIFDAVLDAKLILVEEMQLVALAAMWIALKREQITYSVPSAARMISYSKDLYEGRVDLLLKCERAILQTLNFEIVFPDPFSILYYYIIKCKRSEFLSEDQLQLAYYCGGYMLDLSLFDEDLMKVSAVLLAAAAAETALFFVVEDGNCETEPFWFKWRSMDASRRYREAEIGDVRSTLIERIKESSQRHTDGEIIFKKYSRSRYGRISHFLCTKVRLFLGVN